MEKTTHIVRNYKDTVFRDKARLLELYNAVNQTSYENPEELQIVTLENAVYLGMKNDVAFIIDFHMYLYEHQSTVNPNMPLREAVNTAIDCCIKQGILSEFLRQNKAEVTAMSIFEYDEEAVRRIQRQDAIETGQKLQLIHMILRKLQKGKEPEMIARELDEELQTVIRICKAAEVCGMDAQSVYEYLEKKCQL